ncbi:DUF2058 domain-containing protein [Rhodoferax fermentans]|uniref:DUF2058 domain-containing protein n=1 Tax=Rhodoferax fermentans TaxID=28066 RepID=UPI00117B9206|nr:DUF2058 domain-containing protein [Rhodoferax fermentans]
MAALAATNSATPSLQSTLLKSRVQQARREADQAEANAENLRLQAEEQDRLVQQARQRAQNFEKQAQTAPSATPAASKQITTQVKSEPTYENTLAGVFQLGKPILEVDLSNTQKNIVNGSLFTLAAQTWASQASPSLALQKNYSQQAQTTPEKTTGRLLNTSA